MNETAFVPLPDQAPAPEKPQKNQSDSRVDRMTTAVSAVAAATYHWNIQSDTIEWDGDISQIFTDVGSNSINTGRAFAALLDPENFTSRFETVMRNKNRDHGDGVSFSIEYSIKPYGRDHEHSIWIEDMGRWYAGPDGRPKDVYGIVRQIDDRHERDQHLQFLSNCDPLTGMMNRARLTEALGESIELANNEQHTGAFLIIAINNLAVVNDAYGFDIADEVVSTIGRRLRSVVRTGDMIGRYSGSKFGIIMGRATKQETGIAADRFLNIARQQVIETQLGPVWAMLSIGGVILPHEQADSNATMSHAEEALTEAMKLPSDGYVCYKPSPDIESVRHLNSRCAMEIVNSLKESRFTLAYQPIVRSSDKQVAFHEALLRMRCDDGEIVTAGHLIPISEKLGLVRLIDQSVVHQVLNALTYFPQAHIALNISGVTANDPRWVSKLTDTLAGHTEVTDRLTIEITETVALHDLDQTVSFIEKLHQLGCKVAIDDFGAGFTSFKNLRLLNVDKVKIDGYFCQNLSQSTENQFFVQTLIELAKKFNLEVVAEWVENQQDADLLTSWGADYLQGSLYGMAVSGSPWGEPANEAEEIRILPSEILLSEDEDPIQEADSETRIARFNEPTPRHQREPADPAQNEVAETDAGDIFTNQTILATQPEPEPQEASKNQQPDKVASDNCPFKADISSQAPQSDAEELAPEPSLYTSDPNHTGDQEIQQTDSPDANDVPSGDILESEMAKLREAIFELDAIRNK